MKVIVGERRTGRTTKLIDWLLQGREQSHYPYWSRVIVCPTHNMVRYTTNSVLRRIGELKWDPCSAMLPHLHTCPDQHQSVLADVKKAVWGLNDLMGRFRGMTHGGMFEYAVDDYDQMMSQVGRVAQGPFSPAIVVIEGSLYDASGN